MDDHGNFGFDRRRFLKGGAGLLVGGAWISCTSTTSTTGTGSSPQEHDEITEIDSSTAQTRESYCVYQVTRISAGAANCPFRLLDTVCVDCPPEGNCLGHASVGARRWTLYSDAEKTRVICSGEWIIRNRLTVVNGEVLQADCEHCPEGGKKGYRFI